MLPFGLRPVYAAAMNKRILPTLITAAFLLIPFFLAKGVHAADGSTDPLIARVQAAYEKQTAFRAAFTQNLYNVSTGQTSTRTGTLVFKQPRFVRWETKSPEKELFIVGQDAVWHYVPEEESVYKYPVSQVLSSKTMLRFLSGQSRLVEDFVEIEIQDKGGNGQPAKLLLIPREPETTMVEATLWADPDTGRVAKLAIVDFYGNENTLELKDLESNPDLSDDLFTFTPPKGTEIFDNTRDMGVQQDDLTQ